MQPGWWLITGGAALIGVGALWLLCGGLPWGRLPGDLVFERPHARVYVPLMSCLLVSLLLTGVLSFIRWLQR